MNTSFVSILKRELSAYFDSSVAGIFLMIFAGLSGGLFMTAFFLVNQAEMRAFFDLLPWLLAIFLSAVSMRAWAEERRGNTLELLLTFPMNTSSLVAGKFLAALIFYITALISTFMIPVMLFTLGVPDFGQVFAGYAGALMLGAFFLSAGIFISGFCRDQIVAFVLTLLFCLGLYLLGQDIVAETLDGWIAGAGTALRSAFGVSPRYEVFVRGVIDFRDVVFFLSGTFLLLLLNAFWMDNRSRRGSGVLFAVGLALCLGIFVVLNSAVSGLALRADWTQGKVFTLAPASRNILKKLQAPALVKLYITPRDKMPTAFKTLERDLVSKLDELRLASGGRLKYEVVHMEASNALDSKQADETAEGQVTKKGVYPFQVQSVESDQMELKLIYSAMMISYLEKPEDIIPQIYPQDLAGLEYKLISKIHKMTFAKFPKIALVSPLEDKNMNPETAAILAQLSGGKMPELQKDDRYEILQRILFYEGYSFDRIALSEKEPLTDEFTALFLLEPHLLAKRQKYEINRFLRNGGSVFMAVQNYSYNYVPERRSLKIETLAHNPQVNDLLSAWGLEVSEKILLDESNEVVTVPAGLFDAPVPVKLPLQIIIPPAGINGKVRMMTDIGSLFYLWGTAVNTLKTKPQGITFTPLFMSSKDSWEVNVSSENGLSPESLKKTKAESRGPFTLGVMAEGIFPDAFAGKPAPDWNEEERINKDNSATKAKIDTGETNSKPGKLVVIGASSLFQNNLIRGGGHYHLIMNMLDSLTFGDELVGIRAKQIVDRTMPKISRDEKLIWRVLVTFLVPFIVLVLSLYRLWMHRASKQNYLRVLKKA